MAIRTVVTRGFGNGTFDGTIALVVTRGYAIGAALNVEIFMASVLVNITPTAFIPANISPVANILSNPSPSTHEQAAVAVSSFAPTDIASLEAWFDFSETDNLYQDSVGTTPVTATGQSIGRVVDKVNSYAAIQATGTKQPTYTTNQQNSEPAATFDGGDLLVLSAFNSALTQPNTILVVAKWDANGDAAVDGDDITNRNVIYTSATGLLTAFAGTNKSSTLSRTASYRLVTGLFSGANSYIRVDGWQGSRANAGSAGLAGLTIGAYYSDANHLLGGIKHVLVFDGELTPSQLSDLEDYFNTDTGITGYSDHKFQLGGDAAYTAAFATSRREFWRFGADDVDVDLIQWVNIDTWVSGTSSTAMPTSGGACVWHPGQEKFYIYGGRAGGEWPAVTTCYSYDPATDTLTQLTETLPAARLSAVTCYYPGDGKVYIFGGITQLAGLPATTTIWVHDPVAGTITDTGAVLPAANAAMGVVYAEDVGLIFIIGGFVSGGASSHNAIVTYDPANPATNAVDTGEVISIPLENQACAYVSGRIYAVNGYSANTTSYSNVIHKIVTSTVTVTTLAETGHRIDDDGVGFYDPVRGLCFFGPFIHSSQPTDNNGTDKRIIWEFDPATETLAAEAALT